MADETEAPDRTAKGPGHLPGLDGLRGLAVLAVVAYHLWPGAVPGGWLGVDVFFVLSGFLITRLLVTEMGRTGRLSFGPFWSRRARRLLPAAFATVAVTAVVAHWWLPPVLQSGFRGDALASLTYVANWRFFATGHSYFAAGTPSPLQHLWSLAIEEQFYVVWPLVLLALWRLTRGRAAVVAAVAGGLALASAVEMAALSGAGGSRAYFGTDTRAQALLLGAVLALLVSAGRLPSFGRGWRWLGAGALLLLVGLALRVDGESAWLYRGGFLLIAAAAAAVVAAVASGRAGAVGRVLGLGGLRAMGRVSYGLYLWHWPVIVFLTSDRVGHGGVVLDAVRIAVMSALTAISYVGVEQPIRHALVAPRVVAFRSVGATAAAVALVVVATLGATAPARQLQAAAGSVQTVPLAPPTTASPSASTTTTRPGQLPPLRVGVVGDSIAFTLAYYGGHPAGLAVRGGGTIGCGVVPTDNCTRWDDLWRIVGQGRPEVVVIMLGAWEVEHLKTADGDYVPETDAARTLVLDHLEQGLALLPPTARLAVLDLPCLTSFVAGESVPADRIAWINDVFRAFVARHADRATMVPIADLLCPGGNKDVRIDGIELRPEGRHFDKRSAPLVWKWLTPRLLAIAGR